MKLAWLGCSLGRFAARFGVLGVLAVAGCSFDSAGFAAKGDGSVIAVDGATRDGAQIDGGQPVDGGVQTDAQPIDGALAIDATQPIDAAPLDAFIFMDAAPPLLGPGDLPSSPRPTTPNIMIDAMFGDWPATVTLVDVSKNSTSAHDHIPPDPTDDADLSAKVGSMYDATGVYIRATVTDDVVKTDSTLLYDDDTFSLQWDALPLSPGGYGNEDRRYYFRADDKGRDEFKMLDAQNDNISFKVRKAAPGYLVELKIPWANLGYTTQPPVGTRVKLGIQLTDDDGTDPINKDAESWLAWYRGPSSCATCCLGGTPDPNHKDVWCDPTVLGSLVIMP